MRQKKVKIYCTDPKRKRNGIENKTVENKKNQDNYEDHTAFP